MKYVNLGRSGLKVSRLCLGCMSYGEPERLPQPWSLDEKASRPLIRQALEAGINFFDTANIYSGGSSEEKSSCCNCLAVIKIRHHSTNHWRNETRTSFHGYQRAGLFT